MALLDFFRRALRSEAQSPNMAHYQRAKKSLPSGLVTLKLVEAESEGSNLFLAYMWQEDLTHQQADALDTLARAYVNCTIGEAARKAGLRCASGPNDATLMGNPIPGWYIGDRSQPTYVHNSRFDADQHVVTLTIGVRFLDVTNELEGHDPVPARLQDVYEQEFQQIVV